MCPPRRCCCCLLREGVLIWTAFLALVCVAAFAHFIAHGRKETRTSHYTGNWDCNSYLSRYPDLTKAFGTDCDKAWTHWRNHGKKEGRKPMLCPVTCKWTGRHIAVQHSNDGNFRQHKCYHDGASCKCECAV